MFKNIHKDIKNTRNYLICLPEKLHASARACTGLCMHRRLHARARARACTVPVHAQSTVHARARALCMQSACACTVPVHARARACSFFRKNNNVIRSTINMGCLQKCFIFSIKLI